MSYGIEVYANDGGLAVSSSYPSLYPLPNSVIKPITNNPLTGSYYATRNGIVLLRIVTTIPSTDPPPLMFIQMNVGDALGMRSAEIQQVNTTFTWAYNVIGVALGDLSFDTNKLRLYRELMPSDTTSGIGIVVKNSSGTIMFDSSKNPLWLGQDNTIPTQTLSRGSTSPYFPGFSAPFDATFSNPLILATTGGKFGLGNPQNFEMLPKRTSTGLTLIPWGPNSGSTLAGPITISDFRMLVADAPGQ